VTQAVKYLYKALSSNPGPTKKKKLATFKNLCKYCSVPPLSTTAMTIKNACKKKMLARMKE
jgi:hypothetical protein